MRKYYTEDELDNLVEKWHDEHNSGVTLYEYLGVSKAEYTKWVINSKHKLLKLKEQHNVSKGKSKEIQVC